MPNRPEAVAFDVIGTLFSLEPLREKLVAAGLPPGALETWFAESLRDSFALAASGGFQPLRAVLDATLDQLSSRHQVALGGPGKDELLDGLKTLPGYPDAADACGLLREAGVRVLVVTNGGAAATEALLANAGLRDRVEQVVSVDEVRLSKPRPEVYRHAAGRAGLAPERLALVAAHAWDVNGAKSAWLTAGFVARGRAFPPTMAPPDVRGDSLLEMAGMLARLPA